MKKQIGIIGMGKMGKNLATNLHNKGWEVIVYNRTLAVAEEMAKQGFKYAKSLKELAEMLEAPRTVWVMLPAGEVTNEMVAGKSGISKYLETGDHLIDGGNSNFNDTRKNWQTLKNTGIHFNDVGTSGGPSGALNGACLMIGGDKENYEYLKPLYQDAALKDSFQFFEGVGAGHFVKMVHNGIEYGMMQAIAEGFSVLKASEYDIDLPAAAGIYDNGSVITSRLTAWLKNAFKVHGPDLKDVSGSVEQSGEGAWTVETAHELNVPVKVIKDSLQFRIDSQQKPSFAGKILTALRNQFGGHQISKN